MRFANQMSPLQRAFHAHGVETNENTRLVDALREMDNITQQEAIADDPNARDWCPRCGEYSPIRDMDENGICCLPKKR